MTIRSRTLSIRGYLMREIASYARDLVPKASAKFGLSRQSIARHLQRMVEDGLLIAEGNTRAREYSLRSISQHRFEITVTPNLQEDREWITKIYPLLRHLPTNVLEICEYGFTEMLNNVIDHSESPTAEIMVDENALQVSIMVSDHGVGIFNKLQQALDLDDPRHALLELAKGKVTSDQANHTGEGVFFTSRMFDRFSILSGTLFFARLNKERDWLLEDKDGDTPGTLITMKIEKDAKQTKENMFSEYASELNDYGFMKTVIPIELVKYEGQELVSRSQAKRLLARCERFTEIVLDFKRIKKVGPAFTDEIFRVFRGVHPEIHLVPINTVPAVQDMIERASQVVPQEQQRLL